MAETDWKSPATCATVDRDGKVAWVNPSNAASSNDAYATNVAAYLEYTDWLRCTAFGFTEDDIPAGATIIGIRVEIERKCSGSVGSFTDSAIYLRKTSGQVGDNKSAGANWTTSDTYAAYGGAADDWNAGLADTDIKSSDFGIDLSAYRVAFSSSTAYVDHVRIKVYFTTSAPQTIYPDGLSVVLSYGEPTVAFSRQYIAPAGYQQAIAYGEPAVNLGAPPQTVTPSGIEQLIAIGQPALIYPQTVSPMGIAVTIAYGQPSIIRAGEGLISVPGIEVVIGYGKPTLYKYVWHVILDGQYATATPPTNRTFVIGRDDYGNPVWGEAHDTAESALVGQRLDFSQELSIPTTSQAAATAQAILDKMRLTKARGVILIPPNCGQEMFDTVELSDKGANQAAVKFRVVGIRFEYNPKQSKYEHKLILGAP